MAASFRLPDSGVKPDVAANAGPVRRAGAQALPVLGMNFSATPLLQ